MSAPIYMMTEVHRPRKRHRGPKNLGIVVKNYLFKLVTVVK